MNWILGVFLIVVSVCFGSFGQAHGAAKGQEGESCETAFDCFGRLTCYMKICTIPEEAEMKEASRKKIAASKVRKSEGNRCSQTSRCPSGLACSATGKCEVSVKSKPSLESARKPVEDHKYARFRAPYKDGNDVFLWVPPTATSQCPDWGNGYAEERATILGEIKTIRLLCYRVNQNKKLVEFKDPEKGFFNNTFSISSDSFFQLKWPSELEAERIEANRRAVLESIELMNKEIREGTARQPIYIESPRTPITCSTIGDLTTCF